MRWARPALGRLALGGLLALVASLLALMIPQVIRVVVNGPLLTSGSRSGVVWASLLVLVLGGVEALLVWLRRVFVATPATGVEHDMRLDLFRHLLDLPQAYHDRIAGGQLLARSMNDLSAIRRWLAFGLIFLVVSSVTIIAGISLLLATSWQLGLLYLVGAVPMLYLGFVFRRRYSVVARAARDQAGDLAATVEESVHGIRVLKAFGRGEDAHDDFLRQADDLRHTELAKATSLSRVSFALITIPETVLALGLGLGIWLAVQGNLSYGALTAFFMTAALVNRPLDGLGALLATTLDARAATDRYLEVIDQANVLPDPDEPVAVPGPSTPEGSSVQLRDVVVDLPGSTSPVLDGLNLTLPPGRTTALVGTTGSGKSTILSLLPRLRDVTGGAVLIDGVDVRDLTRHDVRSLVVPAFEDSILFSSSVRDNVLLGVSDSLPAAEREERLRTALAAAQATFVAELPEGVDTIIGEEGMSLSGGQRQRLSLARAIAAQPRVLVMDDPLSAVDVATETDATSALRELLPGTTTLVVAHRPSTVALADHVAFLHEGRIRATGTHEQLLRTDPLYRYVLTAQEEEFSREDDPVTTGGDR